MERAGLVRRSAPGPVSAPGEELWFADKGQAPRRTAHYIKRLNQLRDQLIHQESKNLEQSLDRFRQQTFQREAVKQSVIRRNKVPGPKRDRTPERNRKHEEKRTRAEKSRKGGASPKISAVIQGEKMIEYPEEIDPSGDPPGEDPEQYPREDTVYQVITAQEARVKFHQQQHPKLRPQQSIPNIHRKSNMPINPMVLTPRSLYNDHESPRSQTFVKQMSLHHKDQQGLYKGRKRRQLMRADADELDLYPDSFRFDMSLSHAGDSDDEEEVRIGRRQYTGPRASPVDWVNKPAKYKLSKHKGATSRSVRPAQRVSNTSWNAPTVPEKNDASITKQNVLEYKIHAQKHGVLGEGAPSKTCLFCTQPDISQQLDYILFSRSGTSIVDDGGATTAPARHVLYDEDVITTDSLRTGRRADGRNQKQALVTTSGKSPPVNNGRKTVQIRMPEVILTQAADESSQDGDNVTESTYSGSLGKTAIQSELRQNEVKALVEDIKDLKEMEESLKHQMEEQEKKAPSQP